MCVFSKNQQLLCALRLGSILVVLENPSRESIDHLPEVVVTVGVCEDGKPIDPFRVRLNITAEGTSTLYIAVFGPFDPIPLSKFAWQLDEWEDRDFEALLAKVRRLREGLQARLDE